MYLHQGRCRPVVVVVSCYLGEWLLSEHAQLMSVPVEINSTAI